MKVLTKVEVQGCLHASVRGCMMKRGVWDACLHRCVLYVYCNLTPINLVDGLIIITNCGWGDLKPVSLRLPDNRWVLLWLGVGGIALIFFVLFHPYN